MSAGIPTSVSAHRMKNLGFQQPDIAPGQYWYLGPYLYYVWGQARNGDWSLSDDWNFLAFGNVGPSPTFTQAEVSGNAAFAYAPSVGEILRVLPNYVCAAFSCQNKNNPCNSCMAESEAEACAIAWIEDKI